ncbi:MAG TPA: putative LPS assembly protein LptD [Bacteroidales bacterium]|nr:putative LPS assembly protein LptD [Bacteroidales bacterium]
MMRCYLSFSQEHVIRSDSIITPPDTLIPRTVFPNLRHVSPDAIDKQVNYTSAGIKRNDLVKKTATLIDQAVVTYGNIEIKADSIVFDMVTNTVFASGIRDSTGAVHGSPVFREGAQEYQSDSLIYNFVTRKAIAYNIVTKQQDGLLHSSMTKLLDDGTSNISRSTYSTCDADHPHFYINLPKAKVYPGKKIISGPGNLVLEGIPLPLAIPFGFFPIQKKRAASGILIPRVGQEQQRGYNLTEGGYYFAISNYYDLAVKGSIYTNGTWILTAESNYNKLYKYNGRFSFSYANNVSGHKGLPDYTRVTNYKIGWSYNQNPKARPGSRFSASVNMSSSGYDKTNSYSVAEHVSTQRQSSISYSKVWEGSPFNFSASMNHSQNVRNKTVSLNLPKINFNMSRIYPLKGKSPGPKKWYQELQFQYSAALDNQIGTYDSLLFTKHVWNNMRSGFRHEAPLSLQLRPFRNFSISPQVTYRGVLYTQKYEKRWVPDYFNPDLNRRMPMVVTDTSRGFFYGHAINPSISASFNPQIYGTFMFRPESRVQAIRHVMKPGISYSYIPVFKGLSSDMYRSVQRDTLGHFTEYSIFGDNIFGTPSLGKRSSSISFSLVNIVEAKVFARNDTTGKPEKVKIIDNFSINTSYNIFADSMKWSPVAMAMRTTLFNNLGVSANANFSLYGINEKGQPTADFALKQNHKLMRFTGFNASLDFDLGELLRGDKKGKQGSTRQQAGQRGATAMDRSPGGGRTDTGESLYDEWGYAIFDVPWSMRVHYNLSYQKPSLKSMLSQTLSVSGNVTLTKKTAITYTSGYDLKERKITMTNIGITRDLHCWTMSFNWVPNGTLKMWNFTIRVKSSVLADLKYERRKDFHDEY